MGSLVRSQSGRGNYIDMPLLEDLVEGLERGLRLSTTIAAVQGILSHYFSSKDGFAIVPRCTREDHDRKRLALKICPYIPGKGLGDHVIVDVKQFEQPMDDQHRDRLQELLGSLLPITNRSWVISISGPEIAFYELGDGLAMEPSFSPSRPSRHQFHLRKDAETVHEMLKYIATYAMEWLDGSS